MRRNTQLTVMCMIQRSCLYKDLMNDAVVYYHCDCSFPLHPFLWLTYSLVDQSGPDRRESSLSKGKSQPDLFMFPPLNHRVIISPISPSWLLYFLFINYSDVNTRRRPIFFLMCSLLQSGNYFSLCFLLVVV